MAEPVLTVDRVSKRYGPVRALDAVSATFLPGEVHAVLGENGAGKSTLMGVIGGFVVPDSGAVALRGRPAPVGRPFEMMGLGVEMVHQHFMLVPQFTVGENLALARLGGLAGRLDLDQAIAPALQAAADLGWEVDPGAIAGGLPVGAQQRIEILKALSGPSDVLILDEPTAVLTPDEADELIRVLRRLAGMGKAIILIAHKLGEVMRGADRVTVLRRGRFIASAPIGEVDESRLAEWMIGDVPVPESRSVPNVGHVILSVQGLRVLGDRGEQAVDDVSFTVRAGEILGLGGVDGNGQVELAEALAGVRPVESGTINGPEARATAYVPQDRQHDGLALPMSVRDNLVLSRANDPVLTWGPFWRPGAVRRWAHRIVHEFSIKVGSVSDPVASLSGGNQQKVVVGRNLAQRPDLLVAVNPTRGLDIGATSFVHRTIRDAAREGTAVVLISTDLDELAALATETRFLSRGRLTDRLVGST